MTRKSRKSKRSEGEHAEHLSQFSYALQSAFREYEKGNLEATATTCRDILSQQSNHPEALHLLGVTVLQSGAYAESISLIQDALSVQPRNQTYHNSLGYALRLSGDLIAAEASLKRALKLQSDFVEAWNNLGMVKHQLQRHEEAVTAYKKALRFRPEAADVYNNLGITRRAMGKPSEALECFQNAIRYQPDHFGAHSNLATALLEQDAHMSKRFNLAVHSFQEARKHMPEGSPESSGVRRNLAHLFRRAVPRWHFPMLNDAARNDAYDRALRETVMDSDLVLDIGTGSGLLAMMAARAGARHVISCEEVSQIADKAREIVSANGFDDRLVVLNKRSDALVVGEDLPEPADALVAEIFDAGLLGEHALTTINHAKQSLLKPGALMIPHRATVYGVLIESEAVWNLDRVSTAGGFDVGAFNEFSNHPTYLQKRLSTYSHRYLSEVFEIFDFDFRGEIFQPRELTIPVPVSRSGVVHAVAFWFSLYLTKDITLSTAPSDGDQHWEQAIQLLTAPKIVSENQVCHVAAFHDDEAIRLDV